MQNACGIKYNRLYLDQYYLLQNDGAHLYRDGLKKCNVRTASNELYRRQFRLSFKIIESKNFGRY